MNSHIIYLMGGKFYSASWIIANFPEYQKLNYVEPFCGGAQVLLKKPVSGQDIIGDINWDIINLYRCAKNDEILLIEKIKSIPDYSSSENNKLRWQSLRAKWRNGQISKNCFERASMFFYLLNFSFSGGFLHSYGTNRENWIRPFTSKIENIPRFVNRIKNVSLLCADFETTIKMFDSPDTLFYCDPPYMLHTTTKESRGGFFSNQSEFPHDRLARVLNSIQGRAMISYFQDASLVKLYPNWRITSKLVTQHTNSIIGNKKKKEECLIMNYSENGEKI